MVNDYMEAFKDNYNPIPSKTNLDINDIMKRRVNIMFWLSKACEELNFKRETYHNCCSLFDRYINKKSYFDEKKFELFAVTCLYIACKLEEICIPSVSLFSQFTRNRCSVDDIQTTEVVIGRELMWKLVGPNLNCMAQIVTTKWDQFLEEFNRFETEKDPFILVNAKQVCKDNGYFIRKKNSTSYSLFREFYTIFDMI